MECSRKDLGEIQRLVCLCVTGAMRTRVTTFMEFLLDLLQIRTIVQAKDFVTTHRLFYNDMWFPNLESSHEKNKSLINDINRDMLRDKLEPEIDFTRRFKVMFPERADWISGELIDLPEDV